MKLPNIEVLFYTDRSGMYRARVRQSGEKDRMLRAHKLTYLVVLLYDLLDAASEDE